MATLTTVSETYWKFTFFFQQSYFGGSETYYSKTPITADQMAKNLNIFLQARCDILWDNQPTLGVRVSNLGTDLAKPIRRFSTFLTPRTDNLIAGASVQADGVTPVVPVDVPVEGQSKKTNNPARWPDQFRAVMQMRCFLSNGSSTTRYLSGIPDAISITEPGVIDLAGNEAWASKWKAWAAHVRTFWGTLARGADPEITVYKVKNQAAAPSLLGVEVEKGDAGVTDLKKMLQLSQFKFKPGGSAGTINGRWYIDSFEDLPSPSTRRVIWLKGTEGIDATKLKRIGFIRPITKQIVGFSLIQPIRVGIHKRGKPAITPVGRRKARILLDP